MQFCRRPRAGESNLVGMGRVPMPQPSAHASVKPPGPCIHYTAAPAACPTPSRTRCWAVLGGRSAEGPVAGRRHAMPRNAHPATPADDEAAAEHGPSSRASGPAKTPIMSAFSSPSAPLLLFIAEPGCSAARAPVGGWRPPRGAGRRNTRSSAAKWSISDIGILYLVPLN